MAAMLASTQPTKLQAWVDAEMTAQHVPGMAVGVYKYGKPVEIVTRGYANLETKSKVRRQTVFEICSITKQFTAAAVLLLVQDGRMVLDDPISKYLNGIPRSWSGVTIRRLLDHTAGVPDRVFADGLTELPLPAAIKKLTSYPLLYAPGERWFYNNSGYWLVGHAIERASGEKFFDFLSHRIFIPLGMSHTFPNCVSRVMQGRARGYAWNGKEFENASPLSDEVGYAAGGLVSTIDDLNIWSKALDDGKLLSAKSRSEMVSPATLSCGEKAWNYAGGGYGLGVFVGSANGRAVEKHSGGWDDASCQLARFPDDGLTVVVLTNVGGYEQRSFVGERIGHLFDSKIKVPQWKGLHRSDSLSSSYVRRLVTDLVKDKVASDGLLTEACRQDILSDHEHLVEKAKSGGLRTLELADRIPQGDTTVYLYRATLKRPLMALIAVTKDKKVADFQLLEPPAA